MPLYLVNFFIVRLFGETHPSPGKFKGGTTGTEFCGKDRTRRDKVRSHISRP